MQRLEERNYRISVSKRSYTESEMYYEKRTGKTVKKLHPTQLNCLNVLTLPVVGEVLVLRSVRWKWYFQVKSWYNLMRDRCLRVVTVLLVSLKKDTISYFELYPNPQTARNKPWVQWARTLDGNFLVEPVGNVMRQIIQWKSTILVHYPNWKSLQADLDKDYGISGLKFDNRTGSGHKW
jgi:hypothetical protein